MASRRQLGNLSVAVWHEDSPSAPHGEFTSAWQYRAADVEQGNCKSYITTCIRRNDTCRTDRLLLLAPIGAHRCIVGNISRVGDLIGKSEFESSAL